MKAGQENLSKPDFMNFNWLLKKAQKTHHNLDG